MYCNNCAYKEVCNVEGCSPAKKKMRLIDANALNIKLLYDDSWDLESPTYGVLDIDIWEAPTIEAIPVEWIEKWIETDRNTKHRTPYYYKRLFRSRLKMMLEDWRKENGI